MDMVPKNVNSTDQLSSTVWFRLNRMLNRSGNPFLNVTFFEGLQLKIPENYFKILDFFVLGT